MTGSRPALDQALGVVRRYPLAALVAAAGAAWLVHRMTRPGAAVRRAARLEQESVPILNMGQARIYDPDTSPRHPGHDQLESRREISARA